MRPQHIVTRPTCDNQSHNGDDHRANFYNRMSSTFGRVQADHRQKNGCVFVSGALEAVVQYLSEVLAVNNCLYFRKLGIVHSLRNLVDQADLFILKHFEEIIKQSEFLDFDLDGLTKLCVSDDLNVSELLSVNYMK